MLSWLHTPCDRPQASRPISGTLLPLLRLDRVLDSTSSWQSAAKRGAKTTMPALFESTPPMLAVALQRIFDDRPGKVSRSHFVNLHRLSFQLLVVLEKPAQHVETV